MLQIESGELQAPGKFAGNQRDHAPGTPSPPGRCLEAVGKRARRRQRHGILRADLILCDHAFAPRLGKLGKRFQNLLLPHLADDQRGQVRLREVAVVVRLLLGAHGVGAALGVVPEPRFLHHAAAAFEHFNLAPNLILEGRANVAKAVDVLNLGLGAEFGRALEHNADIGVAAQAALFHVAVTHAGVEQNLLEPGEVLKCLVGSADVRLTDDFHQRRTASIQVDVGPRDGVGKPVVETLARVFLQVQPRDADAFCRARSVGYIDPAILGERLIELGDLVSLRGIGIEVVLPRKDTGLANVAMDCSCRQHRQLYRTAIQHRQGARQAKTCRAHMGVWVAAIAVHAAAEGLRLSQELDVDFKADDRLVLGKNLRRKCSHG